ncbi:hypothetical protein [Spirillospora sp. NPDC048819]|uniref:hypothetical protein n=1 Tax=Spirillospora sp. NPDC048819 TaxID=3155268 RepID=UPI0033FCEB26
MPHPPELWHARPPARHSTPTSPPAPWATTPLELDDLDIDQALDQLRRSFPGLCIWHGEWSGSFWALLPNRLVEAKTSADLARQLHATAGPTLARRPGPSTRSPDGTWIAPRVPAPRHRRPIRTGHRPQRRLTRLLAAYRRWAGTSARPTRSAW